MREPCYGGPGYPDPAFMPPTTRSRRQDALPSDPILYLLFPLVDRDRRRAGRAPAAPRRPRHRRRHRPGRARGSTSLGEAYKRIPEVPRALHVLRERRQDRAGAGLPGLQPRDRAPRRGERDRAHRRPRRGGRRLLRARRAGRAVGAPGDLRQRRGRRRRAGRIHDHAAARQERGPRRRRPDARAQVGGARGGAADRAALHEGRDLRAVPERHLPGQRRLRHRHRGRVLLRQAGGRAHPRRGRHARRHDPRSRGLRPDRSSRRRRSRGGTSCWTGWCSWATPTRRRWRRSRRSRVDLPRDAGQVANQRGAVLRHVHHPRDPRERPTARTTRSARRRSSANAPCSRAACGSSRRWIPTGSRPRSPPRTSRGP